MSEVPRLGQILLQAGVIDEFQLSAALAEHGRGSDRLGVTLVRLGFLDEGDLVRALASQLSLPIARLEKKRVEPEVLELVPRELAEKYRVLPLFVQEEAGGRALFLGAEDPCDSFAIAEVGAHAGMAIHVVVVAASEIVTAIDRLYGQQVSAQPLNPIGRVSLSAPPERRRTPSFDAARLQAIEELLVERGVLDVGQVAQRVDRLAAGETALRERD